MQTVSISQIKRDALTWINRVIVGGERIVPCAWPQDRLTWREHPKVALVSLSDLKRLQALTDVTAAEARTRQLANLEQARALRERIAARAGSILPDSAQELRELREERGG